MQHDTSTPNTSPPAAFDGGALDDPTPADAIDVLRWTCALHDPPDPVEVRLLHRALPPPPSLWTRSVELPSRVPELRRAEAEGYTPYVSVHPRTRRGDDAVTEAVAVFADFDGIAIDDAIERAIDAGLPWPTMIVSSGGGAHLYWTLARRQPDISAWRTLMQDAARAPGSDPKVGNPERVMRLPGFLNRKYDPPRLCRIVQADCGRRFDWRELRGVIPTKISVAPPPPKPIIIDADRVGDPIRRCVAYIGKMPPAIAGSHGHDAILKVAIAIVKFGISGNDGLGILADWNAKNADPPFSEKDLRHKWAEANRMAVHERGAMLKGRAA